MRILLLFTFIGTLSAQQVVAPTQEQVGSARGENIGNYNVTQSYELGYRYKSVSGDEGMYRSIVNYGNGIRLLGSSLTVNSKDGHGAWFDEILLNTIGLGNDNYQAAVLRVQKNTLYRYDMSWRLNAYFNPGLTVAGGEHFKDTIRRVQDHDLTLLPQSRIQFRVGYSRNTEDGPALSSAQEFDTNFGSPGLPVFANLKRQWNEYRLGADVSLAGFKFTLLRRWDFYKDDTPYTTSGVVIPTAPGDLSAIQQFRRSEPVHGANPGWLGNLFARKKLWGVNARLTYVSGSRDFALNEFASGLSQFGGAATRQIVVSGNANRPDLAGDFNLSLYPSDRLTVVNNTSITSNRIDGNSSYSEVQTAFNLGTTLYFRYLGIRTVTNSTDLNYRLNRWLGLYGGYNYSDRRIRTIEGFSIPAFANSTASDTYEVSSHIHAGRVGVRLQPVKPLSINLDGEIGRANHPLTPIADKNYHALNGRVQYRVKNLQLSSTYRQMYNLHPPFSFSNFSSHSRQYSASASWSPKETFSLDASYTKLHLDTFDTIAFFAGTGVRTSINAVPSIYISNIHAANFAAHFSIRKRADLMLGYSITKDTGDGRQTAAPANLTNPNQILVQSVQTFPLVYQSPMARLSVKISPKVRWNAGYQFYGYSEKFHLFGYYQNFDADTAFTSVLWTF